MPCSDLRNTLLRLRGGDPGLRSLRIDGFWSHADPEDWRALGTEIGRSPNVWTLEFYSISAMEPVVNYRHLELFFRGLNQNRSIRRVFFYDFDSSLLKRIFQHMAPFFQNNKELGMLCLERCCIDTFECTDMIQRSLRECPSLELFILGDCDFADEENIFSELIDATAGMINLKTLTIHRCGEWSAWNGVVPGAVAARLSSPYCPWQILRIKECDLNRKDVCTLTSGLTTNTSLIELDLGSSVREMHDSYGNLLRCLRFSNHCLKTIVGYRTSSHDPLSFLLRLNQWEDKQAVAIRKGLYYNCLVGKFDPKPYHDLDKKLKPGVLPHILATIGGREDDHGRGKKEKHSALFHFIRNMPLEITQCVYKY